MARIRAQTQNSWAITKIWAMDPCSFWGHFLVGAFCTPILGPFLFRSPILGVLFCTPKKWPRGQLPTLSSGPMRTITISFPPPYNADGYGQKLVSTFLGCRGMVEPWQNTLEKGEAFTYHGCPLLLAGNVSISWGFTVIPSFYWALSKYYVGNGLVLKYTFYFLRNYC